MTPGPRPSKSCPDEIKIHLRFNDKRKQIINDMGSGSAHAKVMYLIDQEGMRQSPKSKIQLLAEWETLQKETFRAVSVMNERKRVLIEYGCTDKELQTGEGVEHE